MDARPAEVTCNEQPPANEQERLEELDVTLRVLFNLLVVEFAPWMTSAVVLLNHKSGASSLLMGGRP